MDARLRWILLALAGVVAWAPGRAQADLPVAPGSVRLDGLAAVVGGDSAADEPSFILRSDVELRARLKLSGQAGSVVLGPLPEGLLGATLDELIGELLIEREAARLGLDAPSETRVSEQRRVLAELAGGRPGLEQLAAAMGVGQRELQAIARRRATVAGFLEANLVGTSDVTTAELERAYAAGGHPFTEQPLAEISERLREWIGRERTRCSVQRWVEGLRARADVALLVSYGRDTPDPAAERCSISGPAPEREPEGQP